MQTIEIPNLLAVVIPALLVVYIQWRWSFTPKTSLHALARMGIQLCLIGYLLNIIFAGDNPWVVLLVLTIMLFASSWIALRTVPERRPALFGKALLATFVVNVLLLLFITQLVLLADPWYEPRIVIPLAGMIFAAGMNAVSLFVERYYAELQNQTPLRMARDAAYHASLITSINAMFAVGLVSLPGMMTGQILSGVSPMIAVRYQIMVMLMLFSSAGLTTALFYRFIAKDE